MILSRPHLIASFITAAAGIVAVAGFGNAYAQQQTNQSSTSVKVERVQENCDELKGRLRFAQRNELATRISLGRGYDQKILSLVSAFNSRVAANNVDAPEAIRIAAELQEATSALEFGQLYTVYSDDLSEAIASDCENDPAVTYGWIEKARVDREALAENVQETDRLIGEYIAELERLEKRFTPAINKPKEDSP